MTPPIERVGGLPWWIFNRADTEPETLIEAAQSAGFPTIFLPLPFPMPSSVAFRRGLDRATATQPGQPRRWRYDLVVRPASGRATERETRRCIADLKKHYAVPEEIEDVILEHDREIAVAVVLRWEPDGSRPRRPYRVYQWASMRSDDASRHLPLTDVLRVVKVVPGAESDLMEQRISRKVGRMRTHATAREIGEGVMDALEEVGGVKLRPGLFSVPGEVGLSRGEATMQYLEAVGDSELGMYDLYEELEARTRRPGVTVAALREEIGALEAAIRELEVETVGVGALRTRWYEIEDLQQRLRLNRILLGAEGDRLEGDLAEVRRVLAAAARVRGERLEHEVVLAPATDVDALGHLWEGLNRLAQLASTSRPEAGDLTAANEELAAGQRAVRDLRLRLLVRRLRKLVEAVIHVLEAQPPSPARRKRLFLEALEGAVRYLQDRAREKKLLPSAEARPT